MGTKINCDYCSNYVYDEEIGCSECQVSLDEDEMYRYMSGNYKACPYFQMNNEYKIVRKQIQEMLINIESVILTWKIVVTIFQVSSNE